MFACTGSDTLTIPGAHETIRRVNTGARHAVSAACIADDMTGAIETGALLSRAGHRTEVVWEGRTSSGDCSAVVIDAETRHVSAEEARERSRCAAQSVAGVPRLYIKTDSTLRGQIGATFRGVLEALPGRFIVYSPAYPALGRTVVGGVLYVDGIPVAETAFAADTRFRVAESSIPRLLAGISAEVCDARSDDDLAVIAHSVLQTENRIAAGSGGLARHWADLLGRGRGAGRERTAVRSWLLVCGSLHPISRAPAEHARSLGIPVIAADGEPAGDPAAVARDLAARTAALVETHGFDGIIVFGGDTALAVLDALGCTRLMPVDEVAPGVPLSIAITPGRRLTVVTKAGGFGSENIVECVIEKLRPAA